MSNDTKQSTDPERREYLKHYQRELRQRMRRTEILFEPDEYERIKSAARHHNMKLAPFMRACINAYLKKTYVVPDEESVRELRRGIRAIGVNVNQVARRANRSGVEHQDLEHVVCLIYDLEDRIGEAFRNPREVES